MTTINIHNHYPPCTAEVLENQKEIISLLNIQKVLLNKIVMTQAELKQLLTDTKTQVDKIKTEVNNLLTIISDNANNVPQEVTDAANALKTSVQELDDLNPDGPTEPDPNNPAEG